MISEKEVIRMKVPFPSIKSDLAVNSHMYICVSNINLNYEFIKCQTIKPYMLINNPIKNFYDELPDQTRNPFEKPTRIDCDKIFKSFNSRYSDSLKTTLRSDICDELFLILKNKLKNNTYVIINIDENKLKLINKFIK